MSESTHPNPRGHEPSHGQLLAGYELGSGEKVVIDIAPSPDFSPDADPELKGETNVHIQVAMITMGSAVGIVSALEWGGGYWLGIYGGDSALYDPDSLYLERGKLEPIGRAASGQERLPISVSRDHCAIGLSDDGRLVVENHDPRNSTVVYKVEPGQPKDIVAELQQLRGDGF